MVLVKKLMELFRGLERAYGIYNVEVKDGGTVKKTGPARTVKGEVTLSLWEDHVKGEYGLGIVPITDDGVSYFGAIDVDKYDLDLKAVEADVARYKLPLLPTRTKSGGCHLYCFSQEGVDAALMRAKLEEWAVVLGYAGAEIFPKQSKLFSQADVGNWINMPYMNAEKTDRYGLFNGKPLSLEAYIKRASKLSVTTEILEAIELYPQGDFDGGPPCLQALGKTGFPQGSRNNGLFMVGLYLKKRFPDEWKAKVDQYNNAHFLPPLESSEVANVVKALLRKDYAYTCGKPPMKDFCNKTICKKREFGVGRTAAGADWNIVIGTDVQKVDNKVDDPYWILTVNGQRMAVSADDLQQQTKFVRKCMTTISYKPPMLPAPRWDEQVNLILMNAQEVEGEKDLGPVGTMLAHLEAFCTMNTAETKEEILASKPYNEEGRTYFRLEDFKLYLKAHNFTELNSLQLSRALRLNGVAAESMRLGQKVITVRVVAAFEHAHAVIPPREPKDQEM